MSAPIDIEATPEPATERQATQQSMALERRQSQEVGRALTPKELHDRLEFIRNVMKEEMKEGTDYGKIPGCGDKPGLFQPGAQKLLMTFNLRAQVQKETLRELPHPSTFGHREYEFTIRIFPNGGDPNREGTDGVGTCSTFESKYRYRKAERKCPACGKATIIAGKEEYGGGFLCWKKKNGCGAKFAADDPRIVNQSAEDVENEDPADNWNTVRKMSFKRALVAGVINFTNTSELWTQDLEDLAANANARGKAPMENRPAASSAPAKPAQASRPAQPAKPATQTAPAAQPAKQPEAQRFATAETREWFIKQLKDCEDLATEFYRKLCNPAVLLPTEGLDQIKLEFLPVTLDQMKLVHAAITDFGNGGEAIHPFAPNPLKENVKAAEKAKAKEPAKPQAAKPQASTPAQKAKARDPEWFFDVICPVPRKGMKKAEYDKAPDTIGSLYKIVHEGDKDASDEARKRLFGFANHFKPEPRTVGDKTYQPSQADYLFREALDAFIDWHDKHGQDTNAAPELDLPPQDIPAWEAYLEEDDIPM